MIVVDYRWRKKAKELLYNYTTNKSMLKALEQDIIYGSTPQRDHCYRRGGVSNPTLMKATQLDSDNINRIKQEIEAVDQFVQQLSSSQRRIDRKCLQMLNMVYFRSSHSLLYTAIELGISDSTIKRWNTRALESVARHMGWIK